MLSAAFTSGGIRLAIRASAAEVWTSARKRGGRTAASAGCALSEKNPSADRRVGPMALPNVRRSSDGDQ